MMYWRGCWALLLLCYIQLVAETKATFTEDVLVSERNCQLSLESAISRQVRQAPGDPKDYLDEEITYLIKTTPANIEKAKKEIESGQRFKIFKRTTQGWIVTLGSYVDVWSDIVINNRTAGRLTSMTTVYRWGYSIFQLGIGFGWPLLFGLPEPVLRCDSSNFNDLLNQYSLSDGVLPLFDAGLDSAQVSSIVAEFDLWLRVNIGCILNFETEYGEAANVLYAIDDLNAAMNLRIDLQKDVESASTNRRSSIQLFTKTKVKRRQASKVRSKKQFGFAGARNNYA